MLSSDERLLAKMIFGKHINFYYLKYSPALIFGILALIAVDYFQLLIPELYKMVINGINNGAVEVDGQLLAFDMDFLLDKICLPLLGIILVMVIGRFLWRVCFFGAGVSVETDIRKKMFASAVNLSQQYYQMNKVGTMMSLFTNDLETVQDCFGSGVLMFFDALLLGLLAIYKMYRLDPLLTGFSLIPMVFLFVIGAIVEKYMMMKWEKRQEAFAAISDFSQESFSGISVIKAFVREFAELSAFRRHNKNNEKANVDYTKISTFLNISVTLFVNSVICVILGYGGYLVYKGVFNAGELVEFIGYFTAIVWPVMAVSQLIEMASRGKASLKRISALLDAKPDVFDRKDVKDCGPLRGDIEFRGLYFTYPGSEQQVLSDVTFRINAGENVGVIGKTGSGKTTLVDLILRTYNVPDGTVFLDGHDINTIPIHRVRESAAYVPQDNFLFSDTIARNIGFSADEIHSDEVIYAAKMADVHGNIVDFPAEYETVLGERGVTVSGGQKQRISIARAILKNSPILILDDSVSAVDIKTEKVILDNLANIRRGKTTILIAHRISTVERMDKVIFIEDGRVVMVGTHSELYENCPEYHEMVELQKLDDEAGEGEK